jgi:hypothetical protein
MRNFIKYILTLLIISLTGFYGCRDNSVSPNNYTGNPLVLVGGFSTTSNCVNAFAKNINGIDYAFLSLDTSGIQIVNINNPASPQFVSAYHVSGTSLEVYVAYINNVPYAFVAGGSGGVTILNLTNITSPALDTVLNFSGDFINTVFVDTASRMLYTGGSNKNMYIVNAMNLPQAGSVNTYLSFSYINEIQINKNVAYIAEDGGLDIVNVSNPASPLNLSQGTTNDYAYDVKISGNFALLSNNQNGVIVINISDPANPVEVGILDPYDIGLSCSVDGNLIYVAEDQSGVEVFDISNPVNPPRVAYYTTPGYTENVFFHNGNVLVSDYTDFLLLRLP